MAKEPGTKVLLQVSSGSPTNFVTVAGQQDTEWVPETVTDDVTDKDNTGWGSSLSVLKNGVINCEGVAVWPDTNGLDAIRAAWDTDPPADIECKIILNETGANYIGNFQVTSFNISGSHTRATRYSVSLRNNGPLTYAAS